MVDLKCFQKMARFCSREEIPQAVTDHVRHCLGLAPETEPGHGAARTAKWHRGQVRKRQGVTYDMGRARALAEAAIREAAQVRNHPPDLINPVVPRRSTGPLRLLSATGPSTGWPRWRPSSAWNGPISGMPHWPTTFEGLAGPPRQPGSWKLPPHWRPPRENGGCFCLVSSM